MTEPGVEGSVPEGSVPEGSVPEGSVPEGSVPEGSVPEGSVPDPEAVATVPAAAADEEPLPTLQEEFAELTPDLQRSMFGKPAQMLTGLLIGALVLVVLLIGLMALVKDGAVPLFSPAPLVSPSGTLVSGWPA